MFFFDFSHFFANRLRTTLSQSPLPNGEFYSFQKSSWESMRCQYQYIYIYIHSGNQALQWKIPVFNREYIFKRFIFHCYVRLPEGIYIYLLMVMIHDYNEYKRNTIEPDDRFELISFAFRLTKQRTQQLQSG